MTVRRVPVHCWHNALVVQRARAVVVCPRLCPAGPRVLVSRTVKMQLHVNEHTMPALCWDRTVTAACSNGVYVEDSRQKFRHCGHQRK